MNKFNSLYSDCAALITTDISISTATSSGSKLASQKSITSGLFRHSNATAEKLLIPALKNLVYTPLKITYYSAKETPQRHFTSCRFEVGTNVIVVLKCHTSRIFRQDIQEIFRFIIIFNISVNQKIHQIYFGS